jgi:hypothetical protein
MISIYQKNNSITRMDGEAKELEFRGLSSDTKPTSVDDGDIANGSVFIEIDTGKLFLYDLDNKQWKEV